MSDNRRLRILLVARHPVGGILTFFKYIYGHKLFDEYDFTVIAPGKELETSLSTIFKNDDFLFISCDSNGEMIRRAWQYLRSNKVGLVNSHGFSAGVLMVPVAKLCRVPHLVTTHDIFQAVHFKGPYGKLKKMALSAMFRLMDGIHTVGYEATDNLRSFFPRLSEESIHCIPNGIDTERFFSSQRTPYAESTDVADEYRIGFFGRFMSQKGFRDLVDAIEIITERKLTQRKPIVLTYGWGGYIREEYALIEQRGMKEYFHSMPYTDGMPAAISSVDLVAMPSLWEACPLLAMEVLVSGVPIVGTNCIGLNEVLSGSPAAMVSPKDPESLAAAIASEMNNDRRRKFVAYSFTAKERFSLNNTARSLQKLYARMAKST